MQESATNESQQAQQKNASITEVKQVPKPTEVVSIKKNYSAQDIKALLKDTSVKYGLDYDKLWNTIDGESTFDPYRVGPGGLSVGVAQYILSTWLGNCSDKDDRTNPVKALECMGRMWSQGREYEWDAYCERYYDLKCIKLRGIYPIRIPKVPD